MVGMYDDILQSIALSVARERSLSNVLAGIVSGLVDQPDVALARIWLVDVGDICATCRVADECANRTRCLHLVASDGRSAVESGVRWNGLDGAFRRFPLGGRKIGRIGATGEAIVVADLTRDRSWIARPEWAERERIASFVGQPLVFRGEILGVLGVFARAAIDERDVGWLRTFADHAAVAIANARAFEEIARLRDQLEHENAYLREEVRSALAFGDIVGRSAALEKILRQIDLVARTEATVLVTGESGTGKELVARAIHERSTRAEKPLIRVNCGAVPADLFESEFFGHVRGAFTSAHRDRAGRFELADGGTLFLDEVGEIPLPLQSKLLRVLQEGTFERVGDERTRRADVRLVAATNRDLKREVAEGRFREDLFYRLSVVPVDVPPLRERLEDVPLLAEHFLAQSAVRMGCGKPKLTESHVRELQAYDWPGNVRELQNVIERAVILAECGRLRFDLNPVPKPAVEVTSPHVDRAQAGRILTAGEFKQLERDNIRAALARAGGRVYGAGGAADLLGLKPTTLASRMKALGIV